MRTASQSWHSPPAAGNIAAYPNVEHYVAAKHCVAGVMRTLTVELAHENTRVNPG